MKRAFNFYLLALLAICACTSRSSSKVGTVLITDSLYVAFFEKNGVVMKYMSDEGEPNIIAIHRGLDKIILNARRHAIELAFQSDNTLTQYFFVNQGDSALLTEFEDEIGVDVLSRECLPFDENFKTKYNALLRKDVTGVDEFYRVCALVNETPTFNQIDDADLGEHLLSLKKDAISAIFVENRFIDSLTIHGLMSPDVAAKNWTILIAKKCTLLFTDYTPLSDNISLRVLPIKWNTSEIIKFSMMQHTIQIPV